MVCDVVGVLVLYLDRKISHLNYSFSFAAAYPYTDTDPFILESCPHVYFAGNQNKLEAEYFTHGKYTLNNAHSSKYIFDRIRYIDLISRSHV